MILSGHEILKQINNRRIRIEPFCKSNINPNSYDISIGKELFCYEDDVILNKNGVNNLKKIVIPEEGYIIKKNKFYIAFSLERLNSDFYVPLLHNRSGVARKGLFTHITADLMQLHHDGSILLQLYSQYDIKVLPYQKVAQISFWLVDK